LRESPIMSVSGRGAERLAALEQRQRVGLPALEGVAAEDDVEPVRQPLHRSSSMANAVGLLVRHARRRPRRFSRSIPVRHAVEDVGMGAVDALVVC
jgi:hypothetical protein